MTRMNVIVPVCIAVSLIVGAGPLCEASSPSVLAPPQELVDGLRQAFSLEDDTEREAAIRELLDTHLVLSDLGHAKTVWMYLRQHRQWIDFSPYSDTFWRLAERFQTSSYANLPMYSYLRTAPRDERLAIYRKALRTGSAEVAPWSPECTVFDAIHGAAYDGLIELEDDIRAAYQGIRPALQKLVSFDDLLLDLHLRAGAENRQDAARLAAERLRDMDPLEFRRSMEESPVFDRVVQETLDEVCAVSPFDDTQSPACSAMADLYVTQLALGLSLSKRTPSQGDARRSPDWSTLPEWLNRNRYVHAGKMGFQATAAERCVDQATESWDLEKCLPEMQEDAQASADAQ